MTWTKVFNGGTTHVLFVTAYLLTLVLVDGLKVEKEYRHGDIDLKPMFTALARDHASQFRQDRFLQSVHFPHQQRVQLSVQEWWYGSSFVVRTVWVLLLLYPQGHFAENVKALGSKS